MKDAGQLPLLEAGKTPPRRASDAYELRNSGQTAEFKVCGVKVEKATATEAAELAAALRAGDRLQAAG